jgi:sugar O-acyltransferase (sialic acid O-acetyltransferase NeuD family)
MKPKLILIGGGGHCKSCIDVIEQENKFIIAGIVDINTSISDLLGYPLLGHDDDLAKLKLSYDYALITTGQIKTPTIRVRLFDDARSLGFKLPVIISPRAYVSKYAKIGSGTIVMHDALINAGAIVGDNCIVNTKSLIEHDVIIENNCHISTGAIINGGVIVRQGSFIGSNAVTKESVKTNEKDFIKAGSLFKGCTNE